MRLNRRVAIFVGILALALTACRGSGSGVCRSHWLTRPPAATPSRAVASSAGPMRRLGNDRRRFVRKDIFRLRIPVASFEA